MTARDDYRRQMFEEAPWLARCLNCDDLLIRNEFGVVSTGAAGQGQGSAARWCYKADSHQHDPVPTPNWSWVNARMAEYDAMEVLLHQLVADGILHADEPITDAISRLLDNVGLDGMARRYGYRRNPIARNNGRIVWERDPHAERATTTY